jgi:hypothetical protein
MEKNPNLESRSHTCTLTCPCERQKHRVTGSAIPPLYDTAILLPCENLVRGKCFRCRQSRSTKLVLHIRLETLYQIQKLTAKEWPQSVQVQKTRFATPSLTVPGVSFMLSFLKSNRTQEVPQLSPRVSYPILQMNRWTIVSHLETYSQPFRCASQACCQSLWWGCTSTC